MDMVIPFLLIVVGWNPADPEASMVIQSSLHPSEAACEASGQQFMEKVSPLRSAGTPAAYKFFCIPAPGPDEFDGMFEKGE
jgi:hypothetical protein